VPDVITGYGLCEYGKTGIDAYMIALAQKKKPLIQVAKGAFGRR